MTTVDMARAAETLLTTTRAVRRRLDLTRPVDRATVLDCVRLAAQAPSGGNSQRWHWLLVDDARQRKRLGELYRSAYHEHVARKAAELPDPPDAAARAMRTSSDYLADHLHDVPLLVIPCLTRRLPPNPSPADQAEFYGSILPAVWSFQLALRSRGLVSTYTTVHIRHERAAAAILALPDHVTQVALIPVAHPVGTEFRPATRRRVDDITSWNTWRSP